MNEKGCRSGAGESQDHLVLFTGFEPFAQMSYNPSSDAAVAAAQATKRRVGLSKILRVTYQEGARFGADWLRQGHGRSLVSIGLGRGERRIRVERTAFRECGTTPDESGSCPSSLDGNDDSRQQTSDLDDFVRRLGARLPDYQVVVSDDAGRYVCNATLYYSLCAARETDNRALFIHIPMVTDTAAAVIGEAIAATLDELFDTEGEA